MLRTDLASDPKADKTIRHMATRYMAKATYRQPGVVALMQGGVVGGVVGGPTPGGGGVVPMGGGGGVSPAT